MVGQTLRCRLRNTCLRNTCLCNTCFIKRPEAGLVPVKIDQVCGRGRREAPANWLTQSWSLPLAVTVHSLKLRETRNQPRQTGSWELHRKGANHRFRGHDAVYVADGLLRNPLPKQKNTLGIIAQGISDVPKKLALMRGFYVAYCLTVRRRHSPGVAMHQPIIMPMLIVVMMIMVMELLRLG